jgi:small subunit ribosomal protein S20
LEFRTVRNQLTSRIRGRIVTVASHASALKAHRQNVVRRTHNRELRAKLRTALKDIRAALAANDLQGVRDRMRATVSLIDRMASKGIIHDNAAARYKSRLQKRLTQRAQSA